MAKLENYKGGIQLIAGITQKGGDFALMEANAIQVDEDGTRLDSKLDSIKYDIENLQITTKLFEVTSYEELESKKDEANPGDIGVVTSEYGVKTAYYWNDEINNWSALDGNYNASNIYFKENFKFTESVGTVIVGPSGYAEVSAKGKNLNDFISEIFSKEKPGTIEVPPSVSIILRDNGVDVVKDVSYEVGTTFNPSYIATFNPGKYEYGPETGVEATNWNITSTSGDIWLSSEGSGSEFIITEDTNYSINVNVDYTEGVISNSNMGNSAFENNAKIDSGSISATSASISGYRAWFCGYKDESNKIDISSIESKDIRNLNSYKEDWPTSIETNKMKQIIFASPTGVGYKPVVKNSVTEAPQTVNGPITVQVEGKHGYNAISYDIYYIDNAIAASGTSTFNIAKE